MQLEIPYYLPLLLEAGLEVTLKTIDGVQVFDLNTNAKSHIHMYKGVGLGANTWRIEMRYNESYSVNNLAELLKFVERSKFGRDYINPVWATLLEKYKGKY